MIAAVHSPRIDLLDGNLELLDTVCELGCKRFVDLSDEVSILFLQNQVRQYALPRYQYPLSSNLCAQELSE